MFRNPVTTMMTISGEETNQTGHLGPWVEEAEARAIEHSRLGVLET